MLKKIKRGEGIANKYASPSQQKFCFRQLYYWGIAAMALPPNVRACRDKVVGMFSFNTNHLAWVK